MGWGERAIQKDVYFALSSLCIFTYSAFLLGGGLGSGKTRILPYSFPWISNLSVHFASVSTFKRSLSRDIVRYVARPPTLPIIKDSLLMFPTS